MSTEILTVWGPVFLLVMMSGLFSGLTLGLLSLDINALEVRSLCAAVTAVYCSVDASTSGG